MFNFQKRRQLRHYDRLHLACGKHILPGWANIDQIKAPDVIQHDLTRPLPVPQGSISLIFAEHFIEHIRRDQAVHLVRECYRMLKPGGVLRVSTPDLKKLISEYLAQRTDEWRDVNWLPNSPCQMVNEGMRLWGHQFVYDEKELASVLREGGFTQLRTARWRESEHPELNGLECRPFHDEIIMEAIK
jgi:predicted SAM-dependent methyltransferase